MDRLHVLTVTGNICFGGDQNRILSLARTIDGERFHHRVLIANQQTEALAMQYGSLAHEFATHGIEPLVLEKKTKTSGGSSMGLGKLLRGVAVLITMTRRLMKVIRQHKIQVISGHTTYSFVVVVAARLMGIPSMVTLYQPLTDGWYKVAGRYLLRAATVIVTDSQKAADDIRSWVVGTHPRIEIIPNGIYPPISEKTRAEIASDIGLYLSDEPIVIGQVSRLNPYKGHFYLLEAAARILEAGHKVKFLFVGYENTPGYLQQLHDKVAELGLSEAVMIHGYPGPIADMWTLIDIHVHASYFDSLPQAIIEGMSLKKPAVVTDVGGVANMVTHNETGIVVPPKDVTALTAGLTRMLEEPETRARFAEAAQRRFLQRYQPQHTSKRLEDLFDEMVGRKEPSP